MTSVRTAGLFLLLAACGSAPTDPGSGREEQRAAPGSQRAVVQPAKYAPGAQLYLSQLPAPGPYHVAALEGGALVASRNGRTLSIDASGRIQAELPFGGHVTTDRDQNLFLAGEFNDQVELGDVVLQGVGGLDAWVAKLDSNLKLVWVERLATAAQDRPREILADGQGGVVLMGTGFGTRALGPDGQTIWSSPLSGTDMALDAANDVWLLGGFIDELVIGQESHYSDQPGVFVAELDERGTVAWSRTFSGSGPVHGDRITTDPSGGFAIVGSFRGTVAFAGAPLSWFGEPDEPYTIGFIASFEPGGRPRFSSTTEIANNFELVADGSGNLVLTGNQNDAEPYLDLRVLAPDGAELWRKSAPGDIEVGAGFGFDVAIGDEASLFWSLDAYANGGAVLTPYITKLAL